MAKVFTPIDGKIILTALARQATGQTQLATVNAANYVSIGETVLATGMENVYNALGILIGRTLVAVRPYDAKLKLIQAIDTGMYTSRLRKISYYSKDADHSGFFNTDLFTNLADGYTNGQNLENGDPKSLKSMWEQRQAIPVELNFGGSVVWDYGITMYEDQVKAAFRSAGEMERFISGILTEHANDIETGKEAYNRLALLTHIGRTYSSDFATMAINMTQAFNDKFNTTYTSEELRSTYLKEFTAFMATTINQIGRFMSERSTAYHNPMTITKNGESYNILRHTGPSERKLFLFAPLFEDVKAMVFPEIFHEGALDIKENYEGVDFWQANSSYNDRAKVKVTVPTRVNGVQTGTKDVDIPYLIGMMFDKDALMVDYQLEKSYTTPIEARKGYRNTWLHIARNTISDDTENSVVFYMAD